MDSTIDMNESQRDARRSYREGQEELRRDIPGCALDAYAQSAKVA